MVHVLQWFCKWIIANNTESVYWFSFKKLPEAAFVSFLSGCRVDSLAQGVVNLTYLLAYSEHMAK